MRSAVVYIFFFFFSSSICFGQSLTGIWRGYFYEVLDNRKIPGNLSSITGERYKFEVQINHNGKKIQGVTYSYLQKQFYGKAAMTGSFNSKTQNILIQETNMLEMKSLGMESACLMTLMVKYSANGEEETIEGNYFSMNTLDSSNCGRGKVFLRKVDKTDFKEEAFLRAKPGNVIAKAPPIAKDTLKPPRLEPAVIPSNLKKSTDSIIIKQPIRKSFVIPPFDNDRLNELTQSIRLPAGRVQVKIYDNGTIDNDTVTVILDQKKVISKERLTERPLTFDFQLSSEEPDHEVIMVADNLGLYPPNTSLMIVTSGNKRFEVRISSNEKKNAVVIFQLSPENF